jgi:hypothetical protein
MDKGATVRLAYRVMRMVYMIGSIADGALFLSSDLPPGAALASYIIIGAASGTGLFMKYTIIHTLGHRIHPAWWLWLVGIVAIAALDAAIGL